MKNITAKLLAKVYKRKYISLQSYNRVANQEGIPVKGGTLPEQKI